MHEYLAPATLLIAILAGIWLNRRDCSTLKSDMDHRFDEVNRQFGEVNRRLGLIEADQKQFYTVRASSTAGWTKLQNAYRG